MARKAAEPEPPKNESERRTREWHDAKLQQTKAHRQGVVSLFGDMGVPAFPPPPEKEEPPADEKLEPEALEIERGFQSSAAPLPPEAGAEPIGPISLERAEAASTEAYQAETARREREAFLGFAERLAGAEAKERGFVDEHLKPAAEAVAEQVREELAPDNRVEFETEPLGPESFGGSDEESHLMAQTSAAKLRAEAEPAAAEEEAPADGAGQGLITQPVVPEPGASSQPQKGEAVNLKGGLTFGTSIHPYDGDRSFKETKDNSFALFGHNLFGDEVKAKSTGPLSDRFKLPPFTVFDARQGIWQDRKRAWLALGIQSEVGRGENLLNMSDTVLEPDPVKRAEMIAQREAKRKHAFGQEFVLGAQPGHEGRAGGQGKAWRTSDTGLSRKLAPGGGGGGAWIGGPKTSSSGKYGRDGEDDVVLDEDGNPLASKTGTSIFDPVLTELLYSWFAPPGGIILDPFAGGSVRGIVAAKLGRMYVGIELRAEQIAANEKQAAAICLGDAFEPMWLEGDSTNAKELTDGHAFDFLIACPPYGDLEQYSDDPRDLSNMTWEGFAAGYEKIIAAGLELLKPDRFACFVVGDIRDDAGFYRSFPELTVRCFEQHGAKKYNEAILVTSVGSLPIRINKQFGKGRKLGKTHQNVLCFVKGDPKRAAEACGGQQEFSL
jgi:hypothetical protein